MSISVNFTNFISFQIYGYGPTIIITKENKLRWCPNKKSVLIITQMTFSSILQASKNN